MRLLTKNYKGFEINIYKETSPAVVNERNPKKSLPAWDYITYSINWAGGVLHYKCMKYNSTISLVHYKDNEEALALEKAKEWIDNAVESMHNIRKDEWAKDEFNSKDFRGSDYFNEDLAKEYGILFTGDSIGDLFYCSKCGATQSECCNCEEESIDE